MGNARPTKKELERRRKLSLSTTRLWKETDFREMMEEKQRKSGWRTWVTK